MKLFQVVQVNYFYCRLERERAKALEYHEARRASGTPVPTTGPDQSLHLPADS